MTIAPKAIGPTVVGTSAAALYTSATNVTTVLTRASVVNITGAGATLKLWVVRSGDSAADDTLLLGASAAGQTISAGPSDPVVLSPLAGLVLNAGDALWGQSDTASALNFTGSGWTQ